MPGSSFAKKIAAKFKAKTGKNLRVPCVKNSFVAGTLVHTRRGLVPIEDVVIGDYVLSFNEATKKQEYQEIVHLIQHENDYELVKVETSAGDSFVSTKDHPFYVNEAWMDAGDLSLTDVLTLTKGYSSIVGLSSINLTTDVYNFTVANTHNYYIGQVGTLVHNDDCVISVGNMGEFFQTPFGAGIKSASKKIGNKQYDGQSIYKVSKTSGPLKKGDHYYLDALHKDHIEVFDKNGNFKTVLNLDGSRNDAKIAAAIGRSINKIIK